MCESGIPAIRRVAQLKAGNCLQAQAAPLDIGADIVGVGILEKLLVEKMRRIHQQRAQSLDCLAGLLLLRRRRLKVDSGAISEHPHRLAEIQPLFLHDEGENIAAFTACAEAAPCARVGKDDEGRSFLRVKRTQRFIVTPRFLKRGVAVDQLDNVDLSFDIVRDAHRNYNAINPLAVTRRDNIYRLAVIILYVPVERLMGQLTPFAGSPRTLYRRIGEPYQWAARRSGDSHSSP